MGITQDPNVTVTERIKPADANAEAMVAAGRLTTSNDQPVGQQPNGAFIDVQLRGMGASNLTFSYETTQTITVKSGRRGLFRIDGIQIRTDDATRSITIKQGTLRKFH